MSIDIFRAGLNSILTKTLGMKPGAQAPAGVLTPEIQPSLVLECDRPEYSVLGGEYRMHVAGTEADQSTLHWWRIRNPSNSGVLCVVEFMSIVAYPLAATAFCTWTFIEPTITEPAGAAVLPLAADLRAFSPGTTVGGLSPILVDHSEALAVPASFFATRHRNGDTSNAPNCDYVHPVILAPGTACGIVTDTDEAMTFSEFMAVFRVRPFQPNELVPG